MRTSSRRWGITAASILAIVLVVVAGSVAGSAVAQAQPAAGTGTLVIVTTPPGAELRVDGTAAGKSPGSLNNLLPGDHLVEATWPDGKSANAIGRVTPGQSTLVNLSANGAPPPGQAAPGQPAPGPGDQSAGQSAGQNPAPLNQPIPEQTPDATGNAATPGSVAANAAAPIRNPFHPQRRHLLGLSFAPGILCTTVDCAFRGRIAFDFFIGDFHISPVGGLGGGGGGFGFELGSPYFQLGGLTSPFALAIRADIDILALVATVSGTTTIIDPNTGLPITTPTTGASFTGLVVNTYGPNFSIAVAHNISLEARVGFGFGVFFPTVVVPFLVDSWIGIRIQP